MGGGGGAFSILVQSVKFGYEKTEVCVQITKQPGLQYCSAKNLALHSRYICVRKAFQRKLGNAFPTLVKNRVLA